MEDWSDYGGEDWSGYGGRTAESWDDYPKPGPIKTPAFMVDTSTADMPKSSHIKPGDAFEDAPPLGRATEWAGRIPTTDLLERAPGGLDRAVASAGKAALPVAGAVAAGLAAPYLLPAYAVGAAPIVGAVAAGAADRGLRAALSGEPERPEGWQPWMGEPKAKTVLGAALDPRYLSQDAILGMAPGVGAVIGEAAPLATAAARRALGATVSGAIAAGSELASDRPSLAGAAVRAIPSAYLGHGLTHASVMRSDVRHDYGTAPTFDEALAGTVNGRTPELPPASPAQGGLISRMSDRVRRILDAQVPGISRAYGRYLRQGVSVAADSGDPDAVRLMRRVLRMNGTKNRGEELYGTALDAEASRFTPQELDQAYQLRLMMDRAGVPMAPPPSLNARERDAFHFIGELNDSLAQLQEATGVQTLVHPVATGRGPVTALTPFARRANYGGPLYPAELADENLTPLQRATSRMAREEWRAGAPIPQLPADFRTSMTQADLDAALAQAQGVQTPAARGLARASQIGRGDPAQPPLGRFREAYRIKIGRDVHHAAVASAFPGRMIPVDIGEGRSITIGEQAAEELARLRQRNPVLANEMADVLHEALVGDASHAARTAQAFSGRASQGFLGMAGLSNRTQRVTTDWMLGRDVARRGREEWERSPDFRRSALYGAAGGGTPRVATDLENRSLGMRLLQTEEQRLRGYESSGAIVGARDLSRRLAAKRAAGEPFSPRDTFEASEFGASPDWLASRNGVFNEQERGQLLHDWTQLVQGSFEPGRMARVFTDPLMRSIATSWSGFKSVQATLLKRHCIDLIRSGDPGIRQLGIERLGRYVAIQLPQSAKVALLRRVMTGGVGPRAMANFVDQAGRGEVPDDAESILKEAISSSAGYLGDAAILAGGGLSAGVHGLTGVQTPFRAQREDFIRPFRNPATESTLGTAADFFIGDPGDKLKAGLRILAMNRNLPNLGPYAPILGNTAEGAYDFLAGK